MKQFFEAVRALERQLDREPAVPPLALVSPDRMQEQLAQGLPLLPLVPPGVPVAQFLADLGEYRALLARFQPELAAELAEQGERLAAAGDEQQGRLVRALLHCDTAAVLAVAEEVGVGPERLYFLGELTLRPYLMVYAERLESVVDFSAWRRGWCPVCGRAAHLGRIDADNIKHLHCPACEATWRFGRVECSNCGCTEPSKLGFFTAEDDEEHRVEHCGECGHYLKVVNQRVRVRAFDPLVEDAATYGLDLAAAAEGYRKGGTRDRRALV